MMTVEEIAENMFDTGMTKNQILKITGLDMVTINAMGL